MKKELLRWIELLSKGGLNTKKQVREEMKQYLKEKYPEKEPKKKAYTPRIELPMDEIIDLYLNKKWSIQDIAHKYWVSTTLIRIRLRESNALIENRHKLSNDDLERIRKLYVDDLLTLKEIGNIFGVSDMTIRNFMIEHNIPRRGRYERKFK